MKAANSSRGLVLQIKHYQTAPVPRLQLAQGEDLPQDPEDCDEKDEATLWAGVEDVGGFSEHGDKQCPALSGVPSGSHEPVGVGEFLVTGLLGSPLVARKIAAATACVGERIPVVLQQTRGPWETARTRGMASHSRGSMGRGGDGPVVGMQEHTAAEERKGVSSRNCAGYRTLGG